MASLIKNNLGKSSGESNVPQNLPNNRDLVLTAQKERKASDRNYGLTSPVERAVVDILIKEFRETTPPFLRDVLDTFLESKNSRLILAKLREGVAGDYYLDERSGIHTIRLDVSLLGQNGAFAEVLAHELGHFYTNFIGERDKGDNLHPPESFAHYLGPIKTRTGLIESELIAGITEHMHFSRGKLPSPWQLHQIARGLVEELLPRLQGASQKDLKEIAFSPNEAENFVAGLEKTSGNRGIYKPLVSQIHDAVAAQIALPGLTWDELYSRVIAPVSDKIIKGVRLTPQEESNAKVALLRFAHNPNFIIATDGKLHDLAIALVNRGENLADQQTTIRHIKAKLEASGLGRK